MPETLTAYLTRKIALAEKGIARMERAKNIEGALAWAENRSALIELQTAIKWGEVKI